MLFFLILGAAFNQYGCGADLFVEFDRDTFAQAAQRLAAASP